MQIIHSSCLWHKFHSYQNPNSTTGSLNRDMQFAYSRYTLLLIPDPQFTHRHKWINMLIPNTQYIHSTLRLFIPLILDLQFTHPRHTFHTSNTHIISLPHPRPALYSFQAQNLKHSFHSSQTQIIHSLHPRNAFQSSHLTSLISSSRLTHPKLESFTLPIPNTQFTHPRTTSHSSQLTSLILHPKCLLLIPDT